jgi:hypothetical protein
MEALLLQDTYVDSTKNPANNGANANLRVTKSGNQICRSFLKFSLATLAPGATAEKSQAREFVYGQKQFYRIRINHSHSGNKCVG